MKLLSLLLAFTHLFNPTAHMPMAMTCEEADHAYNNWLENRRWITRAKLDTPSEQVTAIEFADNGCIIIESDAQSYQALLMERT